MENKAPKRFVKFTEEHPDIAKAYSDVSNAVHKAGPLDEKTSALIKVAISGGAKMQGAFHSHIRKARILGISREKLEHVAFLALPTLGFPSMMTLLKWIETVYEKK